MLRIFPIVVYAWAIGSALPLPSSEQQPPQKQSERRPGVVAAEMCVSVWDGSHARLNQQIKNTLNDPNSFEFYSTSLSPINSQEMVNNKARVLLVDYSGKNLFGGRVRKKAAGLLHLETCEALLITPDWNAIRGEFEGLDGEQTLNLLAEYVLLQGLMQ